MPRCAEEEPALTAIEGRRIACHLYDGAATAPLAMPEPAAVAS
jgi:hypothetical protein